MDNCTSHVPCRIARWLSLKQAAVLVICDCFRSLHQGVRNYLFVCKGKLWSSLCPVHCFMLHICNWLLVTWLHQHVQVTWHHFDWPDLFTKWTALDPDIDLHLRGDRYNWPEYKYNYPIRDLRSCLILLGQVMQDAFCKKWLYWSISVTLNQSNVVKVLRAWYEIVLSLNMTGQLLLNVWNWWCDQWSSMKFNEVHWCDQWNKLMWQDRTNSWG